MVLFIERFKKLPVVITLGSFLALAGIVMFTNPLDNVAIIFAFFFVLFALVVSAGVVVLGVERKYKLVILSLFIVLLLMFRSNQSLGVVDFLILALTCGGIYFYFSRKP